MLEGPSQFVVGKFDSDAEGSDESDDEEVEVGHTFVGHLSSTSPSHPPSKRFQYHIIASTPRTFQPSLATTPTSLPPASPCSSTSRPFLIPEAILSPINQSRNFPIFTSQQLQHMDTFSRRREELSPLPFPTAQLFQ
ncbi:hypothetical protein O181_111261 [Austropuccinia psidii MF-1]|uniref:Uncharacterized protein n=1 Tax=Austropuccinia psidii MF-1 TaxID=1389203 RepID=A0A9Q3K053_9BASI|nr:hypothetical protein [Austropuccinia psidii MF-1]